MGIKTHLLIMNGPEKRDAAVSKAIEVSEPVFDFVSVLQNGAITGHKNEYIDFYTNSRFNNWIGYVAAYELMLEDVDVGDYFLVLDSDEVPSPELLAFIKKKDFDPQYNTWSMQYMHHQHDNDGKQKYIADSGNGFGACRFFRRDKDMFAKTWLGAHQSYENVPSLYFQSTLHINHIKHDFAIWLSSFSHGVASPTSIGITNGIELSTVMSIRDKYNISPDFVYKNFHKKELWQTIKNEMTPLQYSSMGAARDLIMAVDFIIDEKRDLLELNQFEECGKECCRYE